MTSYIYSWFFGKISRKDSERKLVMNNPPRGVFMIRESETAIGKFQKIV